MASRYGASARLVFVFASLLLLLAYHHAHAIDGQIVDAQTAQGVATATVRVVGTGMTTVADDSGRFTLDQLPGATIELSVSHVAYQPWRRRVTATDDLRVIRLEPLIFQGQEVIVTGTRAKRGESPVAFDNLTQEEVRRAHNAQDLPMLLTESPNVYASSDNGNGIGYSYLSIRGFPQRRVSVLINGVPLNDPESHEVYWIDLPDLTESTEDIQVQRGVGTTLYGSNSIGGTVNVLTNYGAPERALLVSSGVGSYGTSKLSVGFNSGLIDGRHAYSGRFSRIVSDGYRDDAWSDLWSYFLSAQRYDEKWTNRINVFGGPEQTHLAYKGIPRGFIEGDTKFSYNGRSPSGDTDDDRRYNPFEWDGETDNFTQWHYQWITEYRHSSSLRFENTLYYIKGRGYYDQLLSFAEFPAFHLSPVIQPSAGGGSDTISTSDQLWRRPWVDNDFWGAIPRITKTHGRGEFSLGLEYNQLIADHWGEVQSVRPAPANFTPGQRFYDYDGEKIVLSPFAQEVFNVSDKMTLTGALQYAFKRYEVNDNKFTNGAGQLVNHSTDYHIVSPRFGAVVRPDSAWSFFGSISYNELEPTNYDIYDATQYYLNARDFFNEYDSTSGIASGPKMKKEKLLNLEVGASLTRPRWRLDGNVFYMRFEDEIVYDGTVNDLGLYLRVNAPSSVHQGIELAGTADIGRGFTASGNVSLSDNHFVDFTEYSVDRTGYTIAGFPSQLANLRLTYSHKAFELSGHAFHAGRLYIDNSESQSASIDPHTILNLRGAVKLDEILDWAGMALYLQVNNALDTEYETGGWIDDVDPYDPLFIPAAKRNVFAGLRARL